MDQHAPLAMSEVKHLYTKANHNLMSRHVEGLAYFAVGAIREVRQLDDALFAKIGTKAFAEAIRKLDDQARSCTKDRCRGSRYWTRAALESALYNPDRAFCKCSRREDESDWRVRGEHTVPVALLSELLWNMTPVSVDEAKRILRSGCIVAMTKKEVDQVRNKMPHFPILCPFDRYIGSRISDIFDLEVDDGGSPKLVWTDKGSRVRP